jgi:hypothetical protein
LNYHAFFNVTTNYQNLQCECAMAQATSQCRRRWSTDSPFFLHIQHLSTTIMYYFRKLSIVRIFPRAADHTKKSHHQWNLSPQNTLPRETETIMTTYDIVEGFNTKQPSFGRDPPHLVFLPLPVSFSLNTTS